MKIGLLSVSLGQRRNCNDICKTTGSDWSLDARRLSDHVWASQRSLHNAPIFRLLLKVAVKGTHQCDFLNFCGALGLQYETICVWSSCGLWELQLFVILCSFAILQPDTFCTFYRLYIAFTMIFALFETWANRTKHL